MDVIIVCHVEFDENKSRERFTRDINTILKIANRYHVKLTFAIMPEVAKYFPKDVKHEIGLHIHPDDEIIKAHCNLSRDSDALWDYPYKEQLEMIKFGKDYLEDVLGIEPKVFVAGKWSVNNDTIKALIKTNFTHDCSASQRKKFSYCDWSKLPRMCPPYKPSKDDYQKRGNLPLLIIPVSQMWRGGEASPENVPLVGIKWLKACFLEHLKGMPIFHMYLHSTSIKDLRIALAMDEILNFISKFDVNFKFASEIEEYSNVKPRDSKFIYIFRGINKTLMTEGILTLLKEWRRMLCL